MAVTLLQNLFRDIFQQFRLRFNRYISGLASPEDASSQSVVGAIAPGFSSTKVAEPPNQNQEDQRSSVVNAPEAATIEAETIEAETIEAETIEAETIEAEIRATRKFSLADAIGKEGGSFLKSSAAVPRPLQAANAISHFIQTHSSEPTGALSTTLQQWSCQDIRFSRQLDAPLSALSDVVDSLLCEPTTFGEFARQLAIAQSQLTGDRPYFQQPNQPPHPDADYTHEAIRAELKHLQQQLLRPLA